MSKIAIYLIISAIIFGIFGMFGYNAYNQFYGVPASQPTGNFALTVKKGDTVKTLAKDLQDKNVINNSDSFLLLEKLNPINDLQDGEYTLSLNKNEPETVIKKINKESARLKQEKLANMSPSISVTFKEGIRAKNIFELLEQNKIASFEELDNYAKNEDNFDKQKYPFLPEKLDCTYGNAKSCAIYYIEGYLYPDTYAFFTPTQPKLVFEKFLDNFKAKVWNKVQDQIGDKNFQEVIIIASILEKETGRPRTGITSANRDEVLEERKNVAGVVENRLSQKMNIQSDITVEYPSGRKLCQQTFKIENCLFLDEPEALHKYSTYENKGLPIGPITSPEIDNILATLNYNKNDYIYFISDVSGKTYFAKNNLEFTSLIKKITQINKDLGAKV